MNLTMHIDQASSPKSSFNAPSDNKIYVLSGALPDGYFDKFDARNSPRLEFFYLHTCNSMPICDIELYRRKSPILHRLLKPNILRQFIYAINLLITKRKSTHFLCSGEDIGIPLAICSLFLGRNHKIVSQLHGFHFSLRHFKFLVKIALLNKNFHLAALSDSIRQILINRYGVAESRCTSVGYGVDTTFFAPMKKRVGPTLISSAGASSRDYHTLLQAVDGLDCDVRIAAASPWTSYNAKTEIIPSNCEIRSYGNYVNLRQLYADSDIVVIPLLDVDHATGYAALAEILSMGKPVIATKTGAPPDFLIEGESVVFVRPGDADGMRHAIQALLADSNKQEMLAAGGANLMRKTYSIEAFSQRLYSLLA